MDNDLNIELLKELKESVHGTGSSITNGKNVKTEPIDLTFRDDTIICCDPLPFMYYLHIIILILKQFLLFLLILEKLVWIGKNLLQKLQILKNYMTYFAQLISVWISKYNRSSVVLWNRLIRMEINKIIEKIESKQNHLVNKVQVLKEYSTMRKNTCLISETTVLNLETMDITHAL